MLSSELLKEINLTSIYNTHLHAVMRIFFFFALVLHLFYSTTLFLPLNFPVMNLDSSLFLYLSLIVQGVYNCLLNRSQVSSMSSDSAYYNMVLTFLYIFFSIVLIFIFFFFEELSLGFYVLVNHSNIHFKHTYVTLSAMKLHYMSSKIELMKTLKI